jgi:hypothetical protein
MRIVLVLLVLCFVAGATAGVGPTAARATVAAVCENVLPDSSFESSTLTDWSSWQGALSQAPLAAAPDGNYVAQASQASGADYSLELDPAVTSTTAGVAWYASVYVEAASPSALGKPIELTVRERDSGGATVRQTSARTTLGASFQPLSVTAMTAADGDRLDVYAMQGSAVPGDAFYADAASLTATSPTSCGSPTEPPPTEPPPTEPPPTEPPGPSEPPATATFGKTTIGKSSGHYSADTKRVNRFSLGATGTVGKLSVYLQPTGTSGEESIEGVIYSDAGGSPGSLVATSNPLTFSENAKAGWYDLSFATPPTLAPGHYWLGTITGGTDFVIGFRYDPASGSRDGNGNAYAGGPTSAFGSYWQDEDEMSIYATYETSTAVSPPPEPVPGPNPEPPPPPPPTSSCWSSLLPSSGLPFCRWTQTAPSPMNQPLPASPAVDSSSAGIVANLNSGPHNADFSEFGTTVEDTANADTLVKLHCTEAWGTCSLEGKTLAVNSSWRPSWGSDHAMVVVDRANRKVYDLWRAATTSSGTIAVAGGALSTSWGGVTSLDGNGQNPGATGSNLSHLFGMVRMFEMGNAASSPATAIQHALHFASSFTCSTFRYPATKSDGSTSGFCIPEGARVFLDASADCAAVTPVGSEAVCYALQRYGAYDTDTGGSPFAMGFEGDGSNDVPSVYSTVGFGWDYYDMKSVPWSHLHVAADCQCK